MPIFQVTPLGPNKAALDKAVVGSIADNDRYQLANNAGWLVHFKGTSVELSSTLGVTGQPPGVASPIGSTLIVPFTSYYGRGSTEMWEWLKTRFESGA